MKEKFKFPQKEQNSSKDESYGSSKKLHVFKKLSDNIFYLKGALKNSQDIIYRHFYIDNKGRCGTLVYIDGMTRKEEIESNVILPLLKYGRDLNNKETLSIGVLTSKLIISAQVIEKKYFEDLIPALFIGNTLLFIEGIEVGIIIGSKGASKREIGVPTTEQTLRGPQSGFVEDIETNITILRGIIKDIDLAVEKVILGRRTCTDVRILYLSGVSDPELVREIRDRIKKIDIDGIIGSAQIEHLIQENKWTVMPQIVATERPDKTASNLLEGRVVIIADGSPFVLIIPGTFALMLNSPEDYYKRPLVASIIRLVRYAGFIVATSLPGVYIAMTAYHPGMLPTQLALSITGTRVGLPFPLYFEVLLMEVIIDVIQEAAIRLPKPIGPTISIIGGIILGQAVVQAGIVSPIIVIIVSMTAVTAFVFPIFAITQSTRLIRIIIIIAASFFGLFGTMIVWIAFIIYLSSMENFGVRYLEDYSPFSLNKLKDTFLKFPIGYSQKRPKSSRSKNIIKKKSNKG